MLSENSLTIPSEQPSAIATLSSSSSGSGSRSEGLLRGSHSSSNRLDFPRIYLEGLEGEQQHTTASGGGVIGRVVQLYHFLNLPPPHKGYGPDRQVSPDQMNRYSQIGRYTATATVALSLPRAPQTLEHTDYHCCLKKFLSLSFLITHHSPINQHSVQYNPE